MSVIEQGEQESGVEEFGAGESGRRRGRFGLRRRDRGWDQVQDQGWAEQDPGPGDGDDGFDESGGDQGRGDGPEPAADPLRPPEVRVLTGRVRRESVFTLIGSLMVAVTLTQLVSHWFAPFNGLLGFVVVAYPMFLAAYCFIYSLSEDGLAVRDRLVALLAWSAALLVVVVMIAVISYPLWQGWGPLHRWNTYSQDLRATGPLDPVSSGGLTYAIIGTIEQITITMVVTVPLGVGCGLFLNEMPGRLANLVRTVAAAATALPSVVAGLFVYALAILQFGLPLSGFAAGLALSIMTLPIIIRASDVVFRLVPAGLKEASFALGATRWRTALQVTVPTARSGLATAVILGAARGIGETSPVLLTAGYSTANNDNPFTGQQTSLPLATYKLVTSGVQNYITRGYAAAGILMVLVLILFIGARMVGGRGPGQLSGRQRRRRALASQLLVARYQQRGLAPPPAPAPAAGPGPDWDLDPDLDLDLDLDLEQHLTMNAPPLPAEPGPAPYPAEPPGPTPPGPASPGPESRLEPPVWPAAATEENWEQP
ncbi:MAG TPA: PstA family ABC transporter permease [Actinocrinis sp.]|nr:PstA family ABC transporter permease [Actinocrinis sp.]